MITKPFYTSKTFWVNILAAIGCVFVGSFVTQDQWLQISTVVLAVVNIILRLFFTSDGLSLFSEDALPTKEDK